MTRHTTSAHVDPVKIIEFYMGTTEGWVVTRRPVRGAYIITVDTHVAREMGYFLPEGVSAGPRARRRRCLLQGAAQELSESTGYRVDVFAEVGDGREFQVDEALPELPPPSDTAFKSHI